MVNTIIISEKQFETLHKNLKQSTISENLVISDWLSPDERYVIFLDELYDLKEKKLLGDVWENFDNMKLFLTHSFKQSHNVPKNIKESCLRSLKKMVITESNQDFRIIKPIVKKMINEGFWDSAWEKTKSIGKDLWSSAKEIGSDIVTGVKDFGSAISQGDYKEALRIIGKGVIYLARKIRSALHSPVGLILDAILIISGIGKTIQWIPWAIVVALDIYELSTGDYEHKDRPQWARILLMSCDVLGLVLSGLVATGAMKYIMRNYFKYATMGAFLKGMKNDKEGQEHLTKMENVYNDGGWLKKLGLSQDYVSDKNSKIGDFIGEQKNNASILPELFKKEVQEPAAELSSSNTSSTGGPFSWTSSSTGNSPKPPDVETPKTKETGFSKNILNMFGIKI